MTMSSNLAFLIAFVLFVSNLSQVIRGDGPDEYSGSFRLIGFLLMAVGFILWKNRPKED